MSITLHKGDLPDNLDLGPIIAVDTETMGLNPVRDRLCLVQLSSGDGNAHLVQIANGQTDAPNLKRTLEEENTLSLFHFGRFDIAALKAYLNIDCTSVYCTKTASKLCRTFTDRHGLKDLCRDLIGVELKKQQQSSDWGADELTKEQLDYAASDVFYLHQLKEKLDVMIEREGRTELLKKLNGFLPVRAELDLIGWPEIDIFAHNS